MTVDAFVAILLLGLVAGLQYGLLGVGIVLVYKASRFVNFAHGQMGVIAAAILAKLVLGAGWSYWLALPVALAGAAAVGAVVERTVVARLFHASRLVLMIATIGVAQVLFVATLRGPLAPDGAALVSRGYPVPFHFSWTVGSVVIDASRLTTLVIGPLLAVALWAFFARTTTGRAIRAASSNPDAARLAGISVRRVSLLVWIAAGVLSGLTAILLAPGQPTVSVANLGPSLLLRGLAAALIGRMVELPTALIAGVALGLTEQAVFWYSPQGGSADVTVLIVVLLAIAVRGRALAATLRRGEDLVRTAVARRRMVGAAVERRARHVGRAGWALLAASALLLPLVPGFDRQDKAILLVFLAAYALVGLSLTVLTGWAGQASLGHFALLGLGSYAAARADAQEWAVPAVLIVAGVVSAVAAVVVGLPALRYRGLFLAVTTLAFALAAQSWLFSRPWVSEGSTGNAVVTNTRLPGLGAIETPRAVYFLAVAVVAVAVLALRALRNSGVGRSIMAVRDDEWTAAAHAISPTVAKVTALAISGALAGVAGGLWAMAQQTWSFQAFDPTMSLTMLSLVIVGGLGTLHGPLLGAVAVFAWPFFIPDQNTFVVRSVSSGALLLVILLFLPGGLAAALERAREQIVERLPVRRGEQEEDAAEAVTTVAEPDPASLAPAESDGADALAVDHVSVTFGGLQALDDVSIRVGPREIVGLIGTNGAGKTTLMNCVSGHQVVDRGAVRILGHEASELPTAARARLGMGRSFQDARLFPELTVLDTVRVALERTDPSDVAGALTGAPWVRRAEERKREAAMSVLDRFGLAGQALTLVDELSMGMRRLLELAAVTAASPRLVLLDEPTAGIAQREVEALAPRLAALRDDLDCAVLIIEHDVPLLMSLCDRLYVLESGRVIAEGTPDVIRGDPRVIASYLGTDPAAIERSTAGAAVGASR